MKKYKYIPILTCLLLGCLTPLDRAKQQATQIINTQHQILVDFVTWDKKHQLEIVQTAKTKPLAKKQLTEYRARRDKFVLQVTDLLEEEDPDALIGILDTSQVGVVVSKLKKQAEDLRVKILEFERREK